MVKFQRALMVNFIRATTISNSIRMRFVESRMVSMQAIDVETLKGVVQLSGFANSQSERNEADRIARSVSGVRDVRNNIIVRP